MRARRRLLVLTGAVLLAAPASCGVPADGATRPVDPTAIPYALASPPPTSATSAIPPPAAAASGPGRVYFLDRDLELTSVAITGTSTSLDDSLRRLLRRLVAGPVQGELDEGLQSALGPDVQLALGGTLDGVVTVQASGLSRDQSADRLPLAVAQIVLTLTSVPGVEGVRLQRGGVDREVPLPGGALTSGTLTAQDYAPLLPGS